MNQPHNYPEINRQYRPNQPENALNFTRPQSPNININSYQSQNHNYDQRIIANQRNQQNNKFSPFTFNQQQQFNSINYHVQRPSPGHQNLSNQQSSPPQNQIYARSSAVPPVRQQQIQPLFSPNISRQINQPPSLRNNISNEQILFKMDGIFAQSFKSLRGQHILHTFLVFALLFSVLLLYKFDIFKNSQGYIHGVILQDGQLKQSVLPFLILAESIIILLKIFIYFSTYSKLNFALQIANSIGHADLNEPANEQQNFNNNISQVYLLSSLDITYDQGLQRSIQKVHEQLTKNQIRYYIKTKMCCSYQLHQLFEFGMFVLAIYLIVVLAQDQTTWIQKIVLISTVVYWMLQNYKLIVCTLIMLLCPLITLGVIIFVCYTAQTERRQFVMPQTKKPTNQQIINCGGTCSICMMEFNAQNNVIILPCSDKHMFHQLCIKGWLNFKTTCPNCRFDLSAA